MAKKDRNDEKKDVFTIPRAADGSLRHPIAEAEKRFGSIHDFYCLASLGDVTNAIEFVNLYLPEIAREFDTAQLKVLPSELFDTFLGKKVLDAVFEVPSRSEAPALFVGSNCRAQIAWRNLYRLRDA